MSKVPITIISGYLGSGKTTLLRNIANESKMKIAILMNEFGEIAIDSKVIKGKNIEMAELSGGCVCCSLSGEFEAAIGEILEKINPAWIVVETTGVAEPTSLATTVVDSIEGVKLDAIVTVVDLDSLVRFPKIGHTGIEQIEVADLLILNKKDLVKGEKIEEIKNKIKEINQRAIIVETKFAQVDMGILFGIERKEEIKKHEKHKNEFEYFGFDLEEIKYENMVKFFESELPKFQEIYRAKGFAKTERGTFLINYVASRVTFEKFEEKDAQVVFIGLGIGKLKEKIHRMLNSPTKK